MKNLERMKEQLEKEQIPFCCNEPLAQHTSFRIGGPAAVYCKPQSAEELCRAVTLCRKSGERWYVLGKGSNVLFRDAGFDGVVIGTSDIKEDSTANGTTITAYAGTPLSKICRLALENSLTGLEFAYGIPGSLGGAVYMNAGAYGGEMKDVLASVTYLDENGQKQTRSASELELGYRTSIFEKHPEWCILQATLELAAGDPSLIKEKMDDLLGRRKQKQPLEYPSAGSTFKRPQGAFAGELIQRCGLRGARVGDAAISEKHCGFVVNLGNASCEDVLALTRKVCETVKRETGYQLEEEIRVVE